MSYYQNSQDKHATDVSDTTNTSVFLQIKSIMLACTSIFLEAKEAGH